MLIRTANQRDCTKLTEIWNPFIRTTDVTFNSNEKTAKGLQAEIRDKADLKHPFMVAEDDGNILGFATYGQFRCSNGYRRTMEHTVILAPEAFGKGLGRKLMTALEDHARGNDVHSMFAAVSHLNPEGIAFHKAVGYTEVARLSEVGYKFDQWYDLVLMQKIL